MTINKKKTREDPHLMHTVSDMPLTSTSKGASTLTDRDRLVIEIAKQTAIGMRRSASAHNIRGARDYIDALTFAGLLVQRNMAPDKSGTPEFIDVLEEMTPLFRTVVESGQIADADAALAEMKGEIGIVDRSPSEMLVDLGITAEGILLDLSEHYDLDKRETMQVLSFAIIFALIATTPEADREAEITTTLMAAREKIEHWDVFIPSDEEMFGDFLFEEDDED